MTPNPRQRVTRHDRKIVELQATIKSVSLPSIQFYSCSGSFNLFKWMHWLLTFLSKSVTRKALPMKCFYISLRKMLQKYIFAFHQEVYLVVVECVESICLTFTLNIDDRIIWMLFNQCKCFLMMARASGFRQVASRGDPRSRGSSVSHQEHRLPNPG